MHLLLLLNIIQFTVDIRSSEDMYLLNTLPELDGFLTDINLIHGTMFKFNIPRYSVYYHQISSL